MQNIIILLINKYGYLSIFLLIVLENIFPPIPSEIVLCFSGFISSYTSLSIIGIILFSTAGSILGAVILYCIGFLLNKAKIYKIVNSKVGKILFLKDSDVDKAYDWFNQKGYKTVFFCRFIPVVRSLISIPAGINRMNIIKFVLYTSIGSLIWNSLLIILGNICNDNWNIVALIISKSSVIFLIGIILLFIMLIAKAKKEKNNNYK